MRVLLFFYNLFFPVGLLFFLPGLIVKYRNRPGWKSTFGERFGRFTPERVKELAAFHGAVWVHAVSVGEAVVALSSVRAWLRRDPELKIVISTTTTTGQELVRKQLPERCAAIFCPIDFFPWVRRAFDVIRPSELVIFETELWPELIAEARRRGIPAALVNARMSDHSARGYRRFRLFFAPLLRMLDLVAAQSEADLARYLSVAPGVNAVNTGNLKFDQQVPADLAALDTGRWFGARPEVLIAAASTHPGEEALIAKTFRGLLAAHPGARLVIVPRHAERGAEVAEILSGEGLSYCRKSLGEPPAHPVQVLLADTTGEMLSVMKASDIVIMGKSLAGQDEGHNLIEPALLDKPIVTGAVLKNFRFVQQVLRGAGALTEVRADGELAGALDALLRDGSRRRELGEKGGAAIRRNAGAVDRTLDLLSELKRGQQSREKTGKGPSI